MTLWTVLRHRADGRTPARAPAAGVAVRIVAGLLAAVVLASCAPAEDRGGRATLTGSPTRPPAGEATGDGDIAPEPSGEETPVGGLPWNDEVTAACAQRLDPALTQVAQTADDTGVTSFWSSGGRWAACDLLLDDSDPEPTVLTAHRGAGTGFAERRLALGTSVAADAGQPSAVRFVAGGLLPWPVDEISYTFPDGHTARARFVASDDGSGDVWWSVTYTATEGPLVDPDTAAADLDPVTISIVGAAAEAFRLPWEDAQVAE
jgi:hypothetical protein